MLDEDPSVHLCQITPRPDGFGDGFYGGVVVTWSNNRGDLDPIPSGVLLLSDDGCDPEVGGLLSLVTFRAALIFLFSLRWSFISLPWGWSLGAAELAIARQGK